MKKLITKFIIFILFIAVLIVPVSVSVDPYNVFHYMNPRDNGIESNKGFIKTKYISKHYDEFDSLLFGSSRAGFVDIGYLNEKTGAHFYDMASSESLVKEQTAELKVLIRKGFIPKRVWVLVDDISCFVDPEIHKNMLYRVPYPKNSLIDEAEFYLKYMDLLMIKDSLPVIREDADKKAKEQSEGIDSSYDESTHMSYIDRFYHTGTERLDKVSKFDPNEEQYQKGYWVDYYSLRVDEAVSDMKEMRDICDKYGIELTVITNPLYCLTYETGVQNGYLTYLKKLAEVTDYYNFSGYSDVTENYKYYYETSHFTPEVTRMMIDSVCDNVEQGVFGTHIDETNVESFIAGLENQAIERGISVYAGN